MTEHGLTHDDSEREYLLERSIWLTRMRWVAVAGVAFAAAASWFTSFLEPVPIAVVGAILGVCNALWRFDLARPVRSASPASLRFGVSRQLVVDMAALATLLEFSGGAENPFGMLFAIPAAVGASLLPIRSAVALAAIGGSFQVVVVMAQYSKLLRHHGLHAALGHTAEIVAPLYVSPRFLAGYLCAFALMMASVVYFVGAVTERYRRAEALRREHDRVAQSRERLARIGELSAGVAHAVRNPLHGLLGSAELLRKKLRDDQRVCETLSLMSDAITRIEVMTRRLLSLGQDAPLQKIQCDFDDVVRDALTLASPSTRGSSGKVRCRVGMVGQVWLDPARFSEALVNLVDNALDACRSGGEVTVTTKSERAHGDWAIVEVSDTGPGIPPALASRVFDPFFTTKAVGEGSGLGLAISRRVVEEHGGQVTLESEPGRGTRVRISIPRKGLAAELAT